MRRLNILCEDSKIADARNNAKTIIGEDGLTTALSKDGKLPATHWFCSLEVTDAGYQKIMAVQQHAVIEEGSIKDFLKKWKLHVIREQKAS
jgi:hypothetical protein